MEISEVDIGKLFLHTSCNLRNTAASTIAFLLKYGGLLAQSGPLRVMTGRYYILPCVTVVLE